jgi:hypothetical protein
MKEVIGALHFETSSQRRLAQRVLEKIIAVYIAVRNRLPRFGESAIPAETRRP